LTRPGSPPFRLCLAFAAALAAAPAAAADPPAPVVAPLSVSAYTLVERAPVRAGFAPFVIEAYPLLPAPRKRDDYTPSEDQVLYPLRRSVERVTSRKESAIGWSRSTEASVSFASEAERFPLTADGMVYSIEGELVVHGPAALPLGLRLGPSAAVPGVRLRYAVGLMAADQVLFRADGVLDGPTLSAVWMLSLRPEGGDAAVPVRAVFAVRAEGDDPTACRQAMKGLSAAIIASSDGRVALAERAKDASEWLKPLPMYIPAAQLGAGPPPGKAEGKKADKKAEGGGHH